MQEEGCGVNGLPIYCKVCENVLPEEDPGDICEKCFLAAMSQDKVFLGLDEVVVEKEKN